MTSQRRLVLPTIRRYAKSFSVCVLFVVALVGLFVIGPANAGANLISNGSFENAKAGATAPATGDLPKGGGLKQLIDLDAWTTNGGNCWAANTWINDINDNGPALAQDGDRDAVLEGGGTYISQSFEVTSGVLYTISYYEANRAVGAEALVSLTLASGMGAPDNQIASYDKTAALQWKQFTNTFTPTENTIATLRFQSAGSAAPMIDNVSVTPVPEPSTLVLLVIGVAGLLVCAWRRRRAAM